MSLSERCAHARDQQQDHEDNEPPQERNYRVEYVYLGKVRGTVVSAFSADDAMARFNKENPHVKAVNAY